MNLGLAGMMFLSLFAVGAIAVVAFILGLRFRWSLEGGAPRQRGEADLQQAAA